MNIMKRNIDGIYGTAVWSVCVGVEKQLAV